MLRGRHYIHFTAFSLVKFRVKIYCACRAAENIARIFRVKLEHRQKIFFRLAKIPLLDRVFVNFYDVINLIFWKLSVEGQLIGPKWAKLTLFF